MASGTPEEIAQKEKWAKYGDQILTMAVAAVCITAPLGAIFIAQLGPKWLEKKKLVDEVTNKSITDFRIPKRDSILNYRKMY